MSNDLRFRATLEDHVSSSLQKIKDKFDLVGGQGSSAVAFGVTLASLIEKGFNLVAQGAETAGRAIGEVIKAGIEGEASQRRLEASLKANVIGWDGSTAAIERHIHKNLELGFSDDEQRDSLARLVAATHDVGKAYDVQNVAMDLARFKGISLSDATDALTRIEGGSFRILKSLGIQLADNADQTAALAAVEKVAQGQAEAFANTTEGKLQAAQARFGDTMENIGTHVLPLVADGLDIVTEAMDSTSRSFRDLQHEAQNSGIAAGALQGIEAAAKDLKVSAEDLYQAWQQNGGDMNKAIDSLRHGVTQDFGDIGTNAGKMADDFAIDSLHIVHSTNDINEHLGKLADDGWPGVARAAEESSHRIGVALHDINTFLADDQKVVSDYFDVIITQDKLAATNAEISAERRILASKTATGQEKTDAKSALDQLLSDQAQYLQDLAEHGATSSTVFTDSVADLEKRRSKAGAAEKKEIDAEIRALQLLEAEAQKAAAMEKSVYNTPAGNKGPGKLASGGPAFPGNVYTVGEEGPETLVMGTGGGYVIPNADPKRNGGDGGGMLVLNFNSTWPPTQAQAREIAQLIDRELRIAV